MNVQHRIIGGVIVIDLSGRMTGPRYAGSR